VLADLLPGALLRDAVLVVSFAALVGLAAQVTIPLPFTPVPITGQTFAVLLGGAALGWRRGALGMVLYAAAGVAGLPWFAGHSGGMAVVASASFGYILAYPLAAGVAGALAARSLDRRPATMAGLMVAGNLIIYVLGISWLMADLGVGLARGLELGVLPFLPGDAIKIVLALGLMPAAWRLVGRAGRPTG
jgi:biotin transport system substrate-specific component